MRKQRQAQSPRTKEQSPVFGIPKIEPKRQQLLVNLNVQLKVLSKYLSQSQEQPHRKQPRALQDPVNATYGSSDLKLERRIEVPRATYEHPPSLLK